LVICTHVLESLDMHTIQRAAEEFHRVVHPGGHLFIITAAKEGSDVGDATEMERNTYIFRGQKPEVRIHLFDEDEIVGLFEGFSVVELLFLRLARPPTVPFSGHWVLVGRKAT
ncbi:MAG: class SAM-dependent methyltransferase, partial [Dehalococcoidia bacterium]|nr:class SAM-dependent methyltransferase [Dehalococcoidia bacterium]